MEEWNDEMIAAFEKKVRGCLVGGAMGDALGYPVEFLSYEGIRRAYGPDGITAFHLNKKGVAEISDDTQMTLFTAASGLMGLTRGCTRGVGGDPAIYAGCGYRDWYHTQIWKSRKSREGDCWIMDVPELYSRRAPGNTCLSALRAMEDGQKVENDSCGCGGVMRTAPLAAIYARYELGIEWNDDGAAEAAALTHKHPLGYIPAAVLNHILYAIFTDREGKDLETFIREAIEHFSNPFVLNKGENCSAERFEKAMHTQTRLLKYAVELSHSDMSDVVCIEKIGGGWTGHEALAIAVFCALRYPDDIDKVLVAAVNHSGDSDSTGSIAGQIVGAFSGIGNSRLDIHRLELLDVIEELAHDCSTGCIIGDYVPNDTWEKWSWYVKYCEFRRPDDEDRARFDRMHDGKEE